jgi:hypothetical protein
MPNCRMSRVCYAFVKCCPGFLLMELRAARIRHLHEQLVVQRSGGTGSVRLGECGGPSGSTTGFITVTTPKGAL